MTKLEKRLAIACFAMVAVGALAVRAVFIQLTHVETPPTGPTPTGQSAVRVLTPASSPASPRPSSVGVEAESPTLTTTLDLPADDTRNELLKLSGLVNLAGSPYVSPDQEQWRQAIPVARDLERGTCDCAQRNWLKTFIQMGEFALAGDEENYRKHGEIMVTLGRSNEESDAFRKAQHDVAAQQGDQPAVN